MHLKHAMIFALSQCTVCTVTQKVVSVDDVGKCWVAAEWDKPVGLPAFVLLQFATLILN